MGSTNTNNGGKRVNIMVDRGTPTTVKVRVTKPAKRKKRKK